jgi:hypothetical protein
MNGTIAETTGGLRVARLVFQMDYLGGGLENLGMAGNLALSWQPKRKLTSPSVSNLRTC